MHLKNKSPNYDSVLSILSSTLALAIFFLFPCFRPQPDASNPAGCYSAVGICVAAQLDGLWCPQTALWWLEHVSHFEAPVHHLHLLCYAGMSSSQGILIPRPHVAFVTCMKNCSFLLSQGLVAFITCSTKSCTFLLLQGLVAFATCSTKNCTFLLQVTGAVWGLRMRPDSSTDYKIPDPPKFV